MFWAPCQLPNLRLEESSYLLAAASIALQRRSSKYTCCGLWDGVFYFSPCRYAGSELFRNTCSVDSGLSQDV